MTHRSRLTAVLIDVPERDREKAGAFWSAALGREPKHYDKFPEYDILGEVTPGIEFMVQSTGDDSPRIHIDIETDDVEAETARLVALGAERVDQWLECHVLRLPGGQLACVIPRHSDDFDRLATVWD